MFGAARDAAVAAQRQPDVDAALPASPRGRRHGGLRDGDGRTEQQRDRPPRSAEGLDRAGLRRLHRAADRPVVRQHADSVRTVVSVEEPQRAATASASARGEILFIDGRKLGVLIPGSRKQKQLSDEEIERIAAVYRTFKRDGRPDTVAGFCRVATSDEVREHNYALHPRRYVGSADGR